MLIGFCKGNTYCVLFDDEWKTIEVQDVEVVESNKKMINENYKEDNENKIKMTNKSLKTNCIWNGCTDNNDKERRIRK